MLFFLLISAGFLLGRIQISFIETDLEPDVQSEIMKRIRIWNTVFEGGDLG